jgi:hypothetical protein
MDWTAGSTTAIHGLVQCAWHGRLDARAARDYKISVADLHPTVARLAELMRQLKEAQEARDRAAEMLAAAKARIETCQMEILALMNDGSRPVRTRVAVPMDMDDADTASLPAQVRAYFDRYPDQPMSADDLLRAGLRAEPDHLRSTLNRLFREEGFLKRVSRGVYVRAERKEAPDT